LQEQLNKSLNLKGSVSGLTQASTAYKSNHDPINDTMLNYDDTEQLPTFEDPEILPLVRRTAHKEL
jgi:hypothetical protein